MPLKKLISGLGIRNFIDIKYLITRSNTCRKFGLIYQFTSISVSMGNETRLI